jgi:hypothetical protein
LSVDYGKLDEECVGLRTALITLGQENAEAMVAHEAEITTIHTKYQDYHVRYLKKLRKFCTILEKAVNKNGVKCLPYQGKNSTIVKVIRWFDKDIQALPTAITKVNKNFLSYCITGVLRMHYENDCGHVEQLQTIMNSCGASILGDIPEEIGKLAGRIVSKWWVTHGLPYVMELFHVTPEVRMFFAFCNVSILY